MIESLIKSETRRKLLIKFFVNIAIKGHLNQLAGEFEESTNSVRKELNNLTKANFLTRNSVDNRVEYRANIKHPLFKDIQNILKKYLGIEHLIEVVLSKMGYVHEIYLIGDLANGKLGNQIDVLVVGENLNTTYISEIQNKLSIILKKKIAIIHSNNSDINIDKLLVYSVV